MARAAAPGGGQHRLPEPRSHPCRSGALVVWPEKGAGRRGVSVMRPRPHGVGVACVGAPASASVWVGPAGGGAPASTVHAGGRPGFPASGGLLSWPSASARCTTL